MDMDFTESDPLPPHLVLPMIYDNASNNTSADTQGVELAANWSISDTWRLYAQYTFLHIQLHKGPLQFNTITDPQNQVYLRSSWDLSHDLEFDLIARYVDSIPELEVPSYISMDLRLGWRPQKHLELAVVGQNLLQEPSPGIQS